MIVSVRGNHAGCGTASLDDFVIGPLVNLGRGSVEAGLVAAQS